MKRVRFLQGGVNGVVIDSYLIDGSGKRQIYFSSNDPKLQVGADALRIAYTRFDVRLDNGQIIRELRDWEIIEVPNENPPTK